MPHTPPPSSLPPSPAAIDFAGRQREASDALDALRRALAAHGFTLPSLGLDAAALAGQTTRPLLELGRCTPATALALARALSARDPR